MPKSGEPEPGLAAIGAVILAAGSGRRIGTPKLRLEAAGRSYLELILDRLGEAEIAPVVCIVSADQAEWAGPRLAAARRLDDPQPEGAPGRRQAAASSLLSNLQPEEAPDRPGAAEWSLLVNPHPALGMFSSVQIGVKALQACRGLFIIPVDHPFVVLPTYLQLKQAFQHHPDAVIKPAFQGRPGHPIVLPHFTFAAVLTAQPGTCLREVLLSVHMRRITLAVNDKGILRNINEPGDR